MELSPLDNSLRTLVRTRQAGPRILFAGSLQWACKTSVVVTLTSLIFCQVTAALPQKIDVDDIMRDAKPLIGREIRLASAKCARDISGKYACALKKGKNRIRVESLGLDFQTTQTIRRLLVSQCIGEPENAVDACVFDIEMTISGIRKTSEYAEVVLTARKINLFTSKSL